MALYYERMDSPLGALHIAAGDEALHMVAFDHNRNRIKPSLTGMQAKGNWLTRETRQQLQEYFAGKRTEFNLPLNFSGTPFQLQAWQALQQIPFGQTRNYTEQAESIGNAGAARAVGRANGLNPISIVNPCHRVVAKSGGLAGYAGGIENKHYLLKLEGVIT